MKKSVLIACLALMCANIAQAQKTTRYEGVMIIPKDLVQMRQFLPYISDDKGEGYYDYYENADGDRVKHGKFMFIHKYSVSVWQVMYGQYTHGKKTGVWVVKDSIVAKQRIKKYELNNAKATYANDSLNGSFVYTKCEHAHFYTLSCNFANGRMIGDVTIKYEPYENKTSILQGKIGEDGLPTGIWTLTDKIDVEVAQKRLYMNGVCIYAEEKNQATGERYTTYSVFEGINKMPVATEITGNETAIEYNGQTATRKDGIYSVDGWSDKSFTSQASRQTIAIYEIFTMIEKILPSKAWLTDEILGKQLQNWKYHYTVEK